MCWGNTECCSGGRFACTGTGCGCGMCWLRLSAMPLSLGLSLGSGESLGRVWVHAVPCAGVCVITDTHGAYTLRPLPL